MNTEQVIRKLQELDPSGKKIVKIKHDEGYFTSILKIELAESESFNGIPGYYEDIELKDKHMSYIAGSTQDVVCMDTIETSSPYVIYEEDINMDFEIDKDLPLEITELYSNLKKRYYEYKRRLKICACVKHLNEIYNTTLNYVDVEVLLEPYLNTKTIEELKDMLEVVKKDTTYVCSSSTVKLKD